MQNNNIIDCSYGHHKVNISNFTQSGLNNVYKICRECAKQKLIKYRNKNREKYNKKAKEYYKIYTKNKNKQKLIEIT